MFGPPGHAYVYFTMGMHYCLNVTTEGPGVPGAVLLRAIQPTEGIELMTANRGVGDVLRLASGPGNLAKALDIDSALNGEDMVKSDRLYMEPGRYPGRVRASSRVGVSLGRTLRWRFYAEGNPFVSRGKPS